MQRRGKKKKFLAALQASQERERLESSKLCRSLIGVAQQTTSAIVVCTLKLVDQSRAEVAGSPITDVEFFP
jgi:hypothetical protein